MAINREGFIKTANGLEISKDPEARLQYSFQWNQWLESGDTLASVVYSHNARRNDPAPLTLHNSGIVNSTVTFAEFSGGVADRTYVVECKITTGSGLVDSRQFRINVEKRQA